MKEKGEKNKQCSGREKLQEKSLLHIEINAPPPGIHSSISKFGLETFN